MNLMIIGGAGYIGSHVNKLLNKLGHTTIILDNLSRGFKELVRWGKIIEGDFADSNLLDLIFAENEIDVVMHFSAFAYVEESLFYGKPTGAIFSLKNNYGWKDKQIIDANISNKKFNESLDRLVDKL